MDSLRLVEHHLGVGGLDDRIRIEVGDDPGPGGANHSYRIFAQAFGTWCTVGHVKFQKGSAEDEPPNGVTIESLLAICIDRLEGFQNGPFGCKDNEEALSHICRAMGHLKKRTKDRIKRGVEGKLVK